MKIPSGVIDQYIYFVAVDATDFATRETGLSSFTVYRSRDGGASAAMTAPTINETDATNMPGVYELLLNEDMTIGAGNDTEEMVFHITATGMAPVTRVIELFRPKITAGNTLDVTTTGAAGIDWGNVENVTTTVSFTNTTVGTVTTNTDMRGTDSALLASSAPANFDDLAITATTGLVSVGTNNDKAGYSISGSVTTLDGLNDVSAAEVNTEVDTALSDIRLDELFSVALSAQPLAGSMLADLTEDDAGTQRFSANALEQAPSGGGGSSDWTAGEREEIRGRLGITGTTAAGGNTPTLATQASVDDVPTVAEFNARTLPAASYFDSTADTVDVGAINGNIEAAEDLAASASTIVRAVAQAGTLSTTQMTSDLSEATDDHYNGRIIIWTSGVLKDQATNITDYSGTSGLLTFTAVTEAPSASDTFVIV